MQLRSPARVRQDQARLREEEARPQVADTAEFRDTREKTPGDNVGRISAVVSSDPARGPHLRVVQQHFSGAPPQPRDTNNHARVLYPTPGRAVSDYAVGEYVFWVRTAEADLAAKFA